MEHPFVSSLSQLSLEELQLKLTELYKKLAFASRSGNVTLCNQLRMAIESYQAAHRLKVEETIPKPGDDDDHSTLIDIS